MQRRQIQLHDHQRQQVDSSDAAGLSHSRDCGSAQVQRFAAEFAAPVFLQAGMQEDLLVELQYSYWQGCGVEDGASDNWHFEVIGPDGKPAIRNGCLVWRDIPLMAASQSSRI